MSYESDSTGLVYRQSGAAGRIARWVPAIVVLVVVGGFVSLAWYAYQAGTQSLSEDELLVVEADKSPFKEKPDDPGGMQFPNQDKMIFDTFSGDTPSPPKVERILPPPEEPMPKPAAKDEAVTWVNDKLQQEEKEKEPAKDKEAEKNFVKEEAVDEPAKKAAAGSIVLYKHASEPDNATKALESATASGGKAKAQLGAYKSNEEAQAAWVALSKKYASVLGGRKYMVVKADLGAKGVYYRLRVTGFADTAAARAFCSKLSAKGQACLPVAE